MAYSKKLLRHKNTFATAWILAVALLILAGIGYQLAASQLDTLISSPVRLPVPLKEFPMKVGNWIGTDVPISETVLKVAANDDYLNRLYENAVSRQRANIYVAYSARPRTMLGHRPKVCYQTNGWIHDRTDNIKIISRFGREVPSLLHRFHKTGLESKEIVVLNFYIVNGRITDDERVFTGLNWRTPNLDGEIARYVTQIQISSVLENSAIALAKDLTDLILDYFPDEYGNVQSVK